MQQFCYFLLLRFTDSVCQHQQYIVMSQKDEPLYCYFGENQQNVNLFFILLLTKGVTTVSFFKYQFLIHTSDDLKQALRQVRNCYALRSLLNGIFSNQFMADFC